MNLEVTWQTLLAIAGGIILLLNAGKAIVQLFDPFKELKEKQLSQEAFLRNDKNRLDGMESEIKDIHEALKVLGLALGELINHELSGNDETALRAQQKKLNEFFYKGKE